MDVQFLIAAVIIAAAVIYALIAIARKWRTFSTRRQCSTGCGCCESR